MSSISNVPPPLPRAPASYNKLAGRLVGHGTPTVLAVSSVASAVMAILNFVLSSSTADEGVIYTANAGVFTAVTLASAIGACCFWRYVGAKAIEQSAGDLHELDDNLEATVEFLRHENERLAVQIRRVDEIVALWGKTEAVNIGRYSEETRSLAISAAQFEETVDRLEKLAQLHSEFEQSIRDLKTKILEFKKIAPDLKFQMSQFVEQVGGVTELPDRLEVQITNLDKLDDELIHSIGVFIQYITQFEAAAKKIFEIYKRTKIERDDFKAQLKEYEKRNKDFGSNVTRFGDVVEGLGAQVDELEELNRTVTEEVQAIQDPHRKRVKKKKNREPIETHHTVQ